MTAPTRIITSGPGTTAILAVVVVVGGLLLGDARAVESPRPAVAPFKPREAQAHQKKWAEHLATSVEQSNSLGMTMMLIPPGEFLMGSSPEQIETALHWLTMVPRVAQGEADRIRNEEQPQHRVLLTRPIRIGRTEVTVGQYRRFVTATNYVTETERFGGGN